MNKKNQKNFIELLDVHVHLKSNAEIIHILKGINLKISKDTSISIIGESGAGK